MPEKATDKPTKTQSETKKPVELNEEDLEKTQGAGWASAPIGVRHDLKKK